MANEASGKNPGGTTGGKSDGGRDWSDTLFLPKTDFPMRAGLPQSEPKIIERWQRIKLYEQLRAQAKGRTRFTLHDGPPYANGNIHIGHALNKILKDLVTRSQQMLGFDSNYVPGWDCHGLPIEWKIEEDYMAKGKAKPNLKDPAAVKAFRAECRAFAEHWMKVQSDEFQRLGVVGDWAHPYTTMTFPAEAQIARELMKFAETGQLYRGSKPVMWSVVEKTALAEAEVEYHDYQSDQVWVKFPVVEPGGFAEGVPGTGEALRKASEQLRLLRGSYVVIWTTTPWTLPGNRAISFNSRVDYGLYEVTKAPENNWAKVGEKYILADKLVADVMKSAKVEAFERRAVIDDDTLAFLVCAHPLRGRIPTAALPSPSTGEGPGMGVVHTASGPGTPPTPALPRKGGGSEGGESTASGPYGFDVPLLDGDHVTDDTGTGFVHTAPGHGREDFDIWTAASTTQMLRQRGIPTDIPYTVDENGAFTNEAPGFTGERVITDKGEKGRANDAVIKALADAGMMVARGRLKHQYPHSWRSKKPVIFRNTPQWFIHMDKEIAHLLEMSKRLWAGGAGAGHNAPLARTLRETSLRSIAETEWVPPSGENRIRGMIEAKPDWVVSRQRAWGVPITVFVEKGTHDVLLDPEVNQRIYDAMHKEGADAWFTDTDGARFLKAPTKLAPKGYDPAEFEKINDVLDVWFDSGSTHTYVLEDKDHFPGLFGFKRRIDGGRDRVMYLEGSDQHRGWFHSSLIESSGTRGHAPFDVVLTHGFCLDEKGQKMSKSVGNVVAPQDVIKNSGADIMRLWVAASDYSDDLRIGPEIMKGFVETYRKTRNTLRWMLGTLGHYESTFGSAPLPPSPLRAPRAHPRDAGEGSRVGGVPSPFERGATPIPGPSPVKGEGGSQQSVASGRLPAGESEATSKAYPELERLMLHRLAELDQIIRKAYVEYDYKRVVAQLAQFMNTELSAFYFDIRKDALYCEAPSSAKRKAALATVEQIFRCTTVWLAPILSFTCEEAWLARYGDDGRRSVHLELFPTIPASWRDDALAAKWEQIRRVRAGVTGALELERAAKKIGSSLEAAPIVHVVDPDLRKLLGTIDLAEVCITSAITLTDKPAPMEAFIAADISGVVVVSAPAQGRKCARSWRITMDVGSDPAYPDLSARDAAAMREIEG